MRTTTRLILPFLALAAAVLTPEALSAPPPETFTYQGQLLDGGAPADGLYDFRVRQVSAPSGGIFRATSTHTGVEVVDGLFRIDDIAFDIEAFTIEETFVEIQVRPSGGGSYETLSPRQPLRAAPLALGFPGLSVANPGFGAQLRTQNPSGLGAPGFIAGASSFDSSGFISLGDGMGSYTATIDGDNDAGAAAQGLVQVSSDNGGDGGIFRALSDDGDTTFNLTGGAGSIGPVLEMWDNNGDRTFELRGGNFSDGARFKMFNASGGEIVSLSDQSGGGSFTMRASTGTPTVLIDGDSNDAGSASFRAADGSSTISLDAQGPNDGGEITVNNNTSNENIALIGESNSNSGLIEITNRSLGAVRTARIYGAAPSGLPNSASGGTIVLRGASGEEGVIITGKSQGLGGGEQGSIYLYQSDGSIYASFLENTLALYDDNGSPQIWFNANSGAKNAVVKTQNHGQRLLNAVESTEIWFEHTGSGQLVDGVAEIRLDPVFLETVTISDEHPMRVQITPTASCNGVWVEKHSTGFVVRELMNGTSGASFDFTVKAKRRGVELNYLESFDEKYAEHGRVPTMDEGN